MAAKYPCPKADSGKCRYGGNKAYHYGFVSGTASYCRKRKRWVADFSLCPLKTESEGGDE